MKMHINSFVVIEANDINVYLKEKIDWNAFLRAESIYECVQDNHELMICTDKTVYRITFKTVDDAAMWYKDIMNIVIDEGID